MSLHSFASAVCCCAGALMFGAQFARAEQVTITEFYNTTLKHYVLITDPYEVAAIMRGAAGPGWELTGGKLNAYTDPTDAPGLVPVCRFYGNVAAGGPNSHFFTADPTECAGVKRDPGWTYEAVAFYVRLTPFVAAAADGAKAGQSINVPVYRAYNNGFKPQLGINDGNHRFSIDQSAIQNLVPQGWTSEGIVFYTSGGAAPGATAELCMVPKPGTTLHYSNSAKPSALILAEITGSAAAPIQKITFSDSGVTNESTTPYHVTTLSNGKTLLSWSNELNVTTGPLFTITTDISVAQSVILPMGLVGETQTFGGVAAGTIVMNIPGQPCSGQINGSKNGSFQNMGIDVVRVRGGTFPTCVLRYTQVVSLDSTCGRITGGTNGIVGDVVDYWFTPGLGPVQMRNVATGETTELISIFP